jgi:hypothetical protein
VGESTFFTKKDVQFSKIDLKFKDKNSIVCKKNIFKRYEACLEAGGWHFELVI